MKKQPGVFISAILFAAMFLSAVTCGGGGGGDDSSTGNGFATEPCAAPDPGFGNVIGEVTDTMGSVVSGTDAVTDGPTAGDINGYGRFYICNVPAGQELLITVRIPRESIWGTFNGYAPQSKAVTPVDGKETLLSFRLKQSSVQVLDEATVAAGGLATDGQTKVTFPAGAIVKADGSAYTGKMNVQIATFNAADPADLESFPGDFAGIDDDGIEVGLYSLGFVDVQLFDDAENPLQLATGKTATLTFPVANLAAGDTSIPMWYFDEGQGTWIREGEGTVDLGSNTITAEVGHFTQWNADKPVNLTDCVVGIAKDENGNPLAGALVYGTGQGKGVSDANGAFCINFYPKSTFEVRGSAVANGQIFKADVPGVSFTGPRDGGYKCDNPSVCNALAAPIVLKKVAGEVGCVNISISGVDSTIKKYGELYIYDTEAGTALYGAKTGSSSSVCVEMPVNTKFTVQLNAFNPGARGESFCMPKTFNGADVSNGMPIQLGATAASCSVGGCAELTLTCQSHGGPM